MSKKQVKVGVEKGGGPPPGYVWTTLILDIAYRESRRFLNEDQYQHLAMQLKELAREQDPSHSLTADVRQVEDFLELRDKGGVLRHECASVFRAGQAETIDSRARRNQKAK